MKTVTESLRRRIETAGSFRGIYENGHVQTLLGHLLPNPSTSSENFERVELNLPGGDRLIGLVGQPTEESAHRGYLHIFHGLSGSTDSAYMSRAARVARQLGMTAVMWNHRGCGLGRTHAREPYHSGRSDDLARAIKWGRDRELRLQGSNRGRHGVLGFSLSGNAAILLAAGVVPVVDKNPLSIDTLERELGGGVPDFVISVSPPFDLHKAARRLSAGPSRLYGQSFMPALLKSLDDRADTVELAAQARRRIKLTDSVGTFDAHYTGRASGFRDHIDYYQRASSGPYLDQARCPLVVLSADDDPITHGSRDLNRQSPEKSSNKNPLIVRDFQRNGGHMGFIDRRSFIECLHGKPRWIDERIRLYLEAFLNEN